MFLKFHQDIEERVKNAAPASGWKLLLQFLVWLALLIIVVLLLTSF